MVKVYKIYTTQHFTYSTHQSIYNKRWVMQRPLRAVTRALVPVSRAQRTCFLVPSVPVLYNNSNQQIRKLTCSFHPPEGYSCRILMITSFSEQGSQYQSYIHFLLQLSVPLGSTGNRKIIDFVWNNKLIHNGSVEVLNLKDQDL